MPPMYGRAAAPKDQAVACTRKSQCRGPTCRGGRTDKHLVCLALISQARQPTSGYESETMVRRAIPGEVVKPFIHMPDVSFWDAVGRFNAILDGFVRYRPDCLGAWEDHATRVQAENSMRFTLRGTVIRRTTVRTGTRSRTQGPRRRERSPGPRARRAGSSERS